MSTELQPINLEQPHAIGLARAEEPDQLILMATRWADALKAIMERQKLYALIRGKKYPQVEAWMTIGRMDNVVAREGSLPIRHDDGSYEATAELVRLTDMAVIGRASALCGTPDDPPWHSRSEPARRSMAATRAMSRAFRAQYSWIMALAGYQPTPAEEMPLDDRGHDEPPQRAPKQDAAFLTPAQWNQIKQVTYKLPDPTLAQKTILTFFKVKRPSELPATVYRHALEMAQSMVEGGPLDRLAVICKEMGLTDDALAQTVNETFDVDHGDPRKLSEEGVETLIKKLATMGVPAGAPE